MAENQTPNFDNHSDMIRRLRKERNLTALELAEKMGVSSEYISKIELGEIQPTQEQIEVLKSFIEGKL